MQGEQMDDVKTAVAPRKRRGWRCLHPLWFGLPLVSFAAVAALALATHLSMAPLPTSLDAGAPRGVSTVRDDARPVVLARDGTALTRTYQNHFNVHDTVALHEVPTFLRAALVRAEDKRFDTHNGIDWQARVVAAWQNLRAGRAVRGASTVSEQVAKMLNPRPRSLWTRWVEGFEAMALERRFSKADILEFYLNQLPYASNRRGVVQAARYYFDRSVQTLSRHEMLLLAVLPRAPSRLDPRRHPGAARGAVTRLAEQLVADGWLNRAEAERIADADLDLARPELPLHAPHFARAALARNALPGTRIRTTLDPRIQRALQALLEQRLRGLAHQRVGNAAALVVEHASGAIRGWAVASHGERAEASAEIDAVLTPRQPGSTLKPFVYALALEHGMDAASLIEDAPLRQSVGNGEHAYHNYSRRYYGQVTLREALGNSLNIPAVRALHRVGTDTLLARLQASGVHSLTEHPDIYGDGLALGNGEVSLFELVQAYTVLANLGVARPLRLYEQAPLESGQRVFSPQDSAIIANILADPAARALEFGRGGVLEMPLQTAVKTGTSSDHRDTWAVGFDRRYTVGVWMGNLDRSATDSLTGSSGPALVLRATFARLRARGENGLLPMPTGLERRRFCLQPHGAPLQDCERAIMEWFRIDRPRSREWTAALDDNETSVRSYRIQHPSPNLTLARDPRIPDQLERYRFALAGQTRPIRVYWIVNGELYAASDGPEILWPLQRGHHTVVARVTPRPGSTTVDTPAVVFDVK
ncbi:MAG: transglycosylase domain-containing protein [Gammaproteobacteria bacterium]|nr:transglycosylase domain-containing protein [Gammaproteobacteria bacterium]